MATIRPADLPAADNVPSGAAIIVDTGATVQKATPEKIVDAAAPLASEADAINGVGNNNRMSALRVKQAMDANLATTAALASTEPGKGAGMVAFKQPEADAVTRDVADKLREWVSVKDYGAVGDGVTDDTAAVIKANAASKTLLFPSGHAFNLQNWVPLAGTRILAQGATINRHSDATYDETGSSAAVVLTNDDIEIAGGLWDCGPGATKTLAWSGSVLVEGGSAVIRDADFTGTWGAIFGHQVQNGSKVCSYLRIQSCKLYDNSHNTYLADIKNLEFSSNHSHDSGRDGLRTYRNVENLVITGNHLYNNGDGTVGQSQDGMDLFFGGKHCIITNNYLYGNVSKGIDIKRGAASASEDVFGEKFIISNNHIFDNGYSGIELAQSLDPPDYNENVQILGNQIYGNQQRGIYVDYGKNVIIADNIIYHNAAGGIRLDNVLAGHTNGNIVYDNVGVGILVTPTCSDISVFNNTCYDSGVGTQTQGIAHNASGRCHRNTVYGNTSVQVSSTVTDGSLKGETLSARVSSSVTGPQYIATPGRPAVITGLKLSASATTSADIILGKRNGTTGAYVGAIYTNAAEALTGNLPATLTAGTWNASNARLSPNELFYLTINNATTAFAMGLAEVEVIT